MKLYESWRSRWSPWSMLAACAPAPNRHAGPPPRRLPACPTAVPPAPTAAPTKAPTAAPSATTGSGRANRNYSSGRREHANHGSRVDACKKPLAARSLPRWRRVLYYFYKDTLNQVSSLLRCLRPSWPIFYANARPSE